MTLIRWFRKRNKQLLAVFGVLIMVGFLIPSLANLSQRGKIDQVIGSCAGELGKEIEISTNSLTMRLTLLKAMRGLGIDQVSLAHSQYMILDKIFDLGAFPALGTYILFFNDPGFSQGLRQSLYSQASSWASDRQEYEQILVEIDELIDKSSDRGLLFFLLAQEAHNAGIYATEEQVSAIIGMCRQFAAQGAIRASSMQAVKEQSGLAERQIRGAIGDYLSILRYCDMLTRSLAMSEPQLKKKIRDQVQLMSITGTYVQFDAGLFLDQVSEPSEADLQKIFEQHKSFTAGKADDDNPHGIGYLLADRLAVEYLKVDIDEAAKLVTQEFEKLSLGQQDEELERYLENNKEQFIIPVPPTEEGQVDLSDPEYYVLDDIAERVKRLWIRDQAGQKAQKLLTQCRRLAQKSGSAKEQSDYAAIAEQISSTSDLAVTYGKSEYLSLESARQFEDFDMAYRMIKSQRGKSLLEILFDSKPLRKRPGGASEEPPLELNEDLTSVQAFDYGDKATTAYMMRIVSVDKEREAVSLDDDGRAGPLSQEPLTDGASGIRKQAIEDWKNLAAYELAVQQGRLLAKEGKGDWQGALKNANETFKQDPNQLGGSGPLVEKTLEEARGRVEQLQEMVRNNPNVASYAAGQIASNARLLRKSLELAQKADGEQESRAVLELPMEFGCLVFSDLEAAPAHQSEYLRDKSVQARKIALANQGRLVLIHFNPDNIEKRMGFEKIDQAK